MVWFDSSDVGAEDFLALLVLRSEHRLGQQGTAEINGTRLILTFLRKDLTKLSTGERVSGRA